MVDPELKALIIAVVDSADEPNGDRIRIDGDALVALAGYVAPLS